MHDVGTCEIGKDDYHGKLLHDEGKLLREGIIINTIVNITMIRIVIIVIIITIIHVYKSSRSSVFGNDAMISSSVME